MDQHTVETSSDSMNSSLQSTRHAKDVRGFRRRFFEDWLTPEGRLSRRLYAFHILGFVLVFILLIFIVAAFFAGLFASLYEGRALPDETTAFMVAVIALLAFWCPMFLSLHVLFRAMLRRWHDAGYGDKAFLVCVCYPMLTVLLIGFGYYFRQGMRYGFLEMPLHAPACAVLLDVCILLAVAVFLLFRDSEGRDNAFGALESRDWLAPDISERPRAEKPMLSSIFRYRGRLNRKRFILRMLLINIPFILFSFVAAFIPWDRVTALSGFPTGGIELMLPGNIHPIIYLETAVGFLYSVLLLYVLLGLFVHRLHDLGMSGWWAVIPSLAKAVMDGWLVLNMWTMTEQQAIVYTACCFVYATYQSFLTGYLIFVKGDDAVNAYGENPLHTV
ncbi:hypothetical protein TAMA11512_00140 [Selenomonas sp. TAMA-11512]|uniref:DUF805 domain-containing protein n=1 Tax=Selenomonas sp. TAMA-11512 TaxID=3095337 RepID=UPI003088DAA9|nr:hypothetical protein TAMA11512_00140 [Selenomonas sp. TAMA-11512]